MVWKPLEGRVILAVEDEAVIAMMLEDILKSLGCRVLGPALNIASAEAFAASERIDAAVMDINVGGEQVYGLAETLRARGVPVILASGYGRKGVKPGWEDAPMISKPYADQEIASALCAVMGITAS